jgi:LacI family transcriptional regulator
VVTRQSTDVLATEDEVVARAVHFIREHAVERIGVAEVARHARLSRSPLEARMKRAIGRSVYQEIQRVRIERIKTLLLETDVPIKQIAARCGFSYVQYMTRAFRQATGQTPAEFRRHGQP